MRSIHVGVLVEAKRRFAPRDVDGFVTGFSRRLLRLHNQPVLLLAPWLSPRTRQLLQQHQINYLDLTGNVSLRVPNAPVVIYTEGAQQDPAPAEQPRRGLQGKLITALVRVLVDAAPPYRVSDLAKASGASAGYVSRTLEVLDEDRLIQRGRAGLVVDVDWEQLLRERVRNYSLTGTNRHLPAVARRGLPHVLDVLRASGEEDVVVTGSAAVRRFARIAAPAQLAVYVPDFDTAVETLDLMPADRGANVLLLRAAHPSQLERPVFDEGFYYAGISQLALDCLGGNGRLPEEGEALLAWMREHTAQWRRTSLAEL